MDRVQGPNLTERAFGIPIFVDVLTAGLNGYGYAKSLNPILNGAAGFAEKTAVQACKVVIASNLAKTIEAKYKISTNALYAANVSLDFIEKAVKNASNGQKEEPLYEESTNNESISGDSDLPETAELDESEVPEEQVKRAQFIPTVPTPSKTTCPVRGIRATKENVSERLRPFTMLFMALVQEANRQIMATNRGKAFYEMATAKANALSETGQLLYENATIRVKDLSGAAIEISETCVYRVRNLSGSARDIGNEIYDKATAAKEEFMTNPRYTDIRQAAEDWSNVACEKATVAKEVLAPYATQLYEAAKPYIPTAYMPTATSPEPTDVEPQPGSGVHSEPLAEQATPQLRKKISVEKLE